MLRRNIVSAKDEFSDFADSADNAALSLNKVNTAMNVLDNSIWINEELKALEHLIDFENTAIDRTDERIEMYEKDSSK